MLSVTKVRVLFNKEWAPITWNGNVWEDTIEAEKFEHPGSQAFIVPEEEVPTKS